MYSPYSVSVRTCNAAVRGWCGVLGTTEATIIPFNVICSSSYKSRSSLQTCSLPPHSPMWGCAPGKCLLGELVVSSAQRESWIVYRFPVCLNRTLTSHRGCHQQCLLLTLAPTLWLRHPSLVTWHNHNHAMTCYVLCSMFYVLLHVVSCYVLCSVLCYIHVVMFCQRYQQSRHEPAAPGRHDGGGAAGRRRHHRRAAQPDHRRGTQVHQQGQRSGHQVGHNHVQCNLNAMLGSPLSRESFRCGLFFPPEVDGELPIAPLYIFNASFPAPECPTQEAERFVQFCHSIVSMSRAGAVIAPAAGRVSA